MTNKIEPVFMDLLQEYGCSALREAMCNFLLLDVISETVDEVATGSLAETGFMYANHNGVVEVVARVKPFDGELSH